MFKAGDQVKILANSNSHQFKIGSVVTLKYKFSYGGSWTDEKYNGAPYIIQEKDFVLYTNTPGVDCIF